MCRVSRCNSNPKTCAYTKKWCTSGLHHSDALQKPCRSRNLNEAHTTVAIQTGQQGLQVSPCLLEPGVVDALLCRVPAVRIGMDQVLQQVLAAFRNMWPARKDVLCPHQHLGIAARRVLQDISGASYPFSSPLSASTPLPSGGSDQYMHVKSLTGPHQWADPRLVIFRDVERVSVEKHDIQEHTCKQIRADGLQSPMKAAVC